MKRNALQILLLIIIAVVTLTGCNETESQVITEEIVIENSQGTYTKGEIIIPKDYEDEKLPLITLGHGYGGTMDSAGGKELAENLAKAGFATVRMDYDHFVSENLEKQTHQYTVDTMVSDQILCIEYMVEHYNVDADRIGLYGRSLGGRVAMEMANESEGGYAYKALALIAPAGNGNALAYYMHGEDKWQDMKAEAETKGYVTHQDVKLTPEFFTSVDDYVPSENGYKFNNPVLVIYNTLDYVVLPETSKECAQAYENSEEIEVTTKNYHGYEMGYENSELKDMLTERIINFFKENI